MITKPDSRRICMFTLFQQTSKYNKIAKATLQLRSDLEIQSKDTANIMELLNKQKTKMDNISNNESLVVSVRGLRSEMSGEKQVSEQLVEHQNAVSMLRRSLKSARDERAAGTVKVSNEPSSRLQHEVQAVRALLAGRTTVELQESQDRLHLAEATVALDERGDKIAAAVRSLRTNVERAQLELTEASELATSIGARGDCGNATDADQLAQFRQHAALVANGKRLATQKLVGLRDEQKNVSQQLSERERQLREAVGAGCGGDAVSSLPHGHDLRQFVGVLRGQSIEYKESRGRLLELQAEAGVMARTRDLLVQHEPLSPPLPHHACAEPGDDAQLRFKCAHMVASVSGMRSSVRQSAGELRDRLASVDRLHHRHQRQKQVSVFVL